MSDGRQRTAVITGGGTGIGRAVAAAFAADGDRVVLIGRRAEPLQQAAAELGPNVTWRQADIADREGIAGAIGSIVEEHGAIDVLVNNAGISNRPVSTRTPLEEAERLWDEYSRVNIKGVLLTTLAAAPHLARPGGRIIFISSAAVYSGGVFPGLAAYAASKAALHGLMRSFARELGPDGITVNTVAPGFIAHTEMTGRVPEDDFARLANTTLVKRVGTADDIAAVVHFLGSPAASYVTAQAIPVDGGRLPG
ncbi:MAG: SDR family oxidoreductase [Chloroflexi bacterium]|nr:SDR family oxidoreductase [Chloroflexota bacterium]